MTISFTSDSQPTIEHMISVVEQFIFFKKGVQVKITLNEADINNELLKLETAYRIAFPTFL